MRAKNDVECPELPDWLQSAEEAFYQQNTSAIDPKSMELLALYLKARQQHVGCAEALAERYETGNVPTGMNKNKALEWHVYAMSIGSIESKLRVAQYYLWQSSHDDVAKAILLAKELIANVVMETRSSAIHVNVAATAALLLLEHDAEEDESQALINDLLAHKSFANHPDFYTIQNRLSKMQRNPIANRSSLCVLNKKISDEGDFKVGIYKVLEQPLTLIGLPDPDLVKATLDSEFPWFTAVNAQVYQQLVVAQFSKMQVFKLRPLLLAGPPGVGKTRWAKRLGELCNVPFRALMAAGSSDAMFLRGTPRGWSSTRPGAVLQTMATEEVANPLILVDELEKASADSRNGRIWDVLLQLLEPTTARVFMDECLCLPCDLSAVSWIATVNEIGKLPQPLLERFTIVTVQRPGPECFMTLMNNITADFAAELGIDKRMLPVPDANEIEMLRRCNGPRELNRTLRMVMEKHMVDDKRNAIRN